MLVPQDPKQFFYYLLGQHIIFGSDDSQFIDKSDQLNAQFELINLGKISPYWGIDADVEVSKKIFLRQTTYLHMILKWLQMADYRFSSVFMNKSIANSLLPSEKQVDQTILQWNPSKIGFFMWPGVYTRPNISFSVWVYSHYCSNPVPKHRNLVF